MKAAEFERQVSFEMQRCRYFTGIQNEACTEGVNYEALAGGYREGMALRLPCLLPTPDELRRLDERGETVAFCGKRIASSREEAEAYVRQRDGEMQDIVQRLNRGENVPGVITCRREDVFPNEADDE